MDWYFFDVIPFNNGISIFVDLKDSLAVVFDGWKDVKGIIKYIVDHTENPENYVELPKDKFYCSLYNYNFICLLLCSVGRYY